MNSSKSNIEKPENLLTFMVPGVYQILCVPKNKVHIGITQNLLERLGKHSATLVLNRHDCPALQEDWNQLGKKNFTFTVVCAGPEWVNKTAREAGTPFRLPKRSFG
nr:putative site-specific DNA endonuclease [Chloroidium sp. KL-2023a]